MSGKRPIILEAGENRLLEPEEKIVGHVTEQEMAQALASKLDASALNANNVFYQTTTASDLSGYYKLVTDVHDADYPAVEVEIESPAFADASETLIAQFASAPFANGFHIDAVTTTTVGTAQRSAGTGAAAVKFKVFHLPAGGSEALVGESAWTDAIESGNFRELNQHALIGHLEVEPGDRIIVRFYGHKIGASGTSPKVKIKLGGATPCRTLLPLPITAMLPDLGDMAYEADAPSDGKPYVRKDGDWTEAIGGGTEIYIGKNPPASPVEGMFWAKLI